MRNLFAAFLFALATAAAPYALVMVALSAPMAWLLLRTPGEGAR